MAEKTSLDLVREFQNEYPGKMFTMWPRRDMNRVFYSQLYDAILSELAAGECKWFIDLRSQIRNSRNNIDMNIIAWNVLSNLYNACLRGNSLDPSEIPPTLLYGYGIPELRWEDVAGTERIQIPQMDLWQIIEQTEERFRARYMTRPRDKENPLSSRNTGSGRRMIPISGGEISPAPDTRKGVDTGKLQEAQKQAEEIREKARQEAGEIREKARQEAEEIRKKARQEAGEIRETARQQAKETREKAQQEAGQIQAEARSENERLKQENERLKQSARDSREALERELQERREKAETECRAEARRLTQRFLTQEQIKFRQELYKEMAEANTGRDERLKKGETERENIWNRASNLQGDMVVAMEDAVTKINRIKQDLCRDLGDWRGSLHKDQYRDLTDSFVGLFRLSDSLDKQISALATASLSGEEKESLLSGLDKIARQLNRRQVQMERALEALGLYVFRPQAGEAFDGEWHELTSQQLDTGLEDGEGRTIRTCVLPGVALRYAEPLRDDRILCKAQVEVDD